MVTSGELGEHRRQVLVVRRLILGDGHRKVAVGAQPPAPRVMDVDPELGGCGH
jgi:hypothetical protein